MDEIRTGLVMEGGAMRGMFTCGVIDVLMEHDLTFDGACAVSAGATFGCNLKSRQIGRALRYNCKYCKDKRYASIWSLVKTGDLFNEDFCYKELPFELDKWDSETFASNPMEFYVTASDVETGKPVYYKMDKGLGEDIRWIQASASMPLLANIVEIENHGKVRKFLDGGVADSIPIRFMEKTGFQKITVILTQPKGFEKKKNKLMPIIKRRYKEYPDFIKAVENRHIRYNNTLKYLEEKEAAGEIFVIRPPEPLKIGKMEKDPKELKRVYNIGRAVGGSYIEKLMEGGWCKTYEGTDHSNSAQNMPDEAKPVETIAQ